MKKLRALLFGPRTKCVMCGSPLKGERVETCSPNCDEWREQRSAW